MDGGLKKTIGYCGIVCSGCPVFQATQKNDEAEKRRVAEMFTKQYGKVYEPKDINCGGCLADSSRIFSYCSVCKIRKCGKEKCINNCASCGDYPCKKLAELFARYSKAKETLDEIRCEYGLI